MNDEVITLYGCMVTERSKEAVLARKAGGKEKEKGKGMEKEMEVKDVHCFNSFFYSTYEKKGFAGVKRWSKKVSVGSPLGARSITCLFADTPLCFLPSLAPHLPLTLLHPPLPSRPLPSPLPSPSSSLARSLSPPPASLQPRSVARLPHSPSSTPSPNNSSSFPSTSAIPIGSARPSMSRRRGLNIMIRWEGRWTGFMR